MIFLVLLAPVLFNLTGLIDNFLTKLFKNHQSDGILKDGTATLMVIGGVAALFVSVVLLPFLGHEIWNVSFYHIGLLISCGLIYGLAAYPYFRALHHESIENIIPILQTIPIFTYIIAAIVLNEILPWSHVLIILLIVCVTMLFGRNHHTKKMNRSGVFLTVGSSLLYAISYVLFKIGGGENISVRTAFFREHLGVAIACLAFGLKSGVASSTLSYFKSNGRKFSILNIFNELFYIIGMMILNAVSLHYPIAVVSTLSNGLQPLLGFLMTRIAFRFLPAVFERSYDRKALFYKVILCIVSCVLLGRFFVLTS